MPPGSIRHNRCRRRRRLNPPNPTAAGLNGLVGDRMLGARAASPHVALLKERKPTMLDSELIGVEVAAWDRPGYKPLIRSAGDWMAALMNGTPDSWRVPDKVEAHPRTAELFVLVAGRAMLITAGNGETPGAIQQVAMRPNVLYNVKAGTWHASPMSPDATFVIIEKTGTDEGGSVYAPLSAEQQAAIRLE